MPHKVTADSALIRPDGNSQLQKKGRPESIDLGLPYSLHVFNSLAAEINQGNTNTFPFFGASVMLFTMLPVSRSL